MDEISLPSDEEQELPSQLAFNPVKTDIGLLARDLYRLFNQAIDERVRRFGLSTNACRYLAVIGMHPGITPKEMSEYFSVRSPTTVSALRILEQKRLVERYKDRVDARKTRYKLTARGVEVEALARASAVDVEALAVGCLSDQEKEEFGRMVARIRSSLESVLAP
ncbi:MarR family winged helix-turn-helix transcriptional regulator [Sphingobium baderi]|uniref:MarR family winged helix-turn-helix transcriptional regulator n=1 Tax=Sphingobium baderi TaxID=1332080 RepID=UPI002B400B9A|nr:MarR family transcriptional regulator [Sphingobium baderi]WRD75846.1 MarR family transcriptional regulator [Sphingobium baderi]|tara:strand:- start:2676 stop:3170 length:495 start_codon:yes stop_codon:yes gene_type:complete